MRKLQCFTSELLQNDPSESESRKIEICKRFHAKSVKISKRFECSNDRMVQLRLQMISSWLLFEVFAVLRLKNASI